MASQFIQLHIYIVYCRCMQCPYAARHLICTQKLVHKQRVHDCMLKINIYEFNGIFDG